MMKLLSLIPLPYKLAILGTVLAVLVAFLWRVHYNIDKGGYERCQAEYDRADKEDTDANNKKQHEIIRLPDADLDGRLDKWMRD